MKNQPRRQFLKTGLAAAAVATTTRSLAASTDSTLNFGVIGTGGRSTLDTRNLLLHVDGVRLTATADLFPDRTETFLKRLGVRKFMEENEEAMAKVDVPAERQFHGFDAYKELLASEEIDAVILTAPPAYRPLHFRAAVEAGKHVFMEKPVAVDPVGIRSVIETGELAKEKGLTVVAGFQQRHMPNYLEVMNRVKDGAIGEIRSLHATWHWGRANWKMLERPAGMTDAEYQIRTWVYHLWASGDHIVEQHCHNLDVMAWAMNEQMPVSGLGKGGRIARTDTELYGNVWDHFNTEFKYEDGTLLHSGCSQTEGANDQIIERIIGTKGTVELDRSMGIITGENAFSFEGEMNDGGGAMFNAMVESIQSGSAVSEVEQAANATLMGIMGRTSAYCGRNLSWNWIRNGSKQDLQPVTPHSLGDLPVGDIAVPGTTPLV